MATQKETIEFILSKLRDRRRFSARAMFGEYALYADGKVVALVRDDRLYVKILPASQALEPLCEKGEPYRGAKPHYIVDEGQLVTLDQLPAILSAIGIAAAIVRRWSWSVYVSEAAENEIRQIKSPYGKRAAKFAEDAGFHGARCRHLSVFARAAGQWIFSSPFANFANFA